MHINLLVRKIETGISRINSQNIYNDKRKSCRCPPIENSTEKKERRETGETEE